MIYNSEKLKHNVVVIFVLVLLQFHVAFNEHPGQWITEFKKWNCQLNQLYFSLFLKENICLKDSQLKSFSLGVNSGISECISTKQWCICHFSSTVGGIKGNYYLGGELLVILEGFEKFLVFISSSPSFLSPQLFRALVVSMVLSFFSSLFQKISSGLSHGDDDGDSF